MSDTVIEMRGLSKRYGRAVAVDNVELTLRRGEVLGLLGPNGAGKTTTILMLLGLTDPTAGEVRVLGFNPAREPLEVKRRVGYLPDSVGFYDTLTARQNLRYSARLMGMRSTDIEARMTDVLKRVELADVADHRVATFSRGMRQRLGLAEVRLKGAEVAILDEPTSALDPQATDEILDMIRGLKADGVTVLLSSHLLDQVQRVCDRVALFNSGRIALQGSFAELAERVLGGEHALVLEAVGGDVARVVNRVPGVRRVVAENHALRVFADRDVRADLASAVSSSGGKLLRLNRVEPSLDEVYRRYFEELRHAA